MEEKINHNEEEKENNPCESNVEQDASYTNAQSGTSEPAHENVKQRPQENGKNDDPGNVNYIKTVNTLNQSQHFATYNGGDGKKVPDNAVDNFVTQFTPNKKWLTTSSQRDRDAFNDNLHTFLSEYVCFVTSEDPDNSLALVYHILKQPAFSKKTKKSIYFSYAQTDKYFELVDLVLHLEDQQDLFIVANINDHIDNRAQGAFLSSVAKQIHNNSIEILEKNRIHILILIPKNVADDIKRSNIGMKRCVNIWEVFDTKKEEIVQKNIPHFFKELNPIEQTVLFAGISFEKLSFRDFNYVVSLLLNNISESTHIVMDVYKDYPEGAKNVKQVFTDDYHDIWEKYRDRFVDNCWLVGKVEHGVYKVNLKYPELTEEITGYLKESQHFFWQKQCSFLEEQKLIFNQNISPKISRGVIDLVADVLADEPYYYSDSWFLELMFAIQLHNGEDYVIRGATQKDQLINFFSDLNERGEFTRFFYWQLIYLLSQLVNRNCKDHVNELLNCLIGYGLHRQLLILVKGIASNESFDKFLWIKQLIERASSEIKNETYSWMVTEIGLRSPLETIEKMKTWLPQDRSTQKYSPSNHYSCYFFVHFFVTDLTSIKPEELNECKNKTVILRNCEPDIENCRSLMAFVLKQFFTAGTRYQFAGVNSELISILRNELLCFPWVQNEPVRKFIGIEESEANESTNKKNEVAYEILIADIIECWHYIIVVQKDLATTTKESLVNNLFESLFKQTEHTTLSKLIAYWQQKAAYYLREAERLKSFLKNKLLTENDKQALTGFAKTLQEKRQHLIPFFDEINKYINSNFYK